MTKLLENIHRAVNIGLMNELKPLADRMGIDLYEVIQLRPPNHLVSCPITQDQVWAATAFRSIPSTSLGRRVNMVCIRFIELAGEINSAMPAYVVEKTMDALNEVGKPLKGSKVLVLGIAYKKFRRHARVAFCKVNGIFAGERC